MERMKLAHLYGYGKVRKNIKIEEVGLGPLMNGFALIKISHAAINPVDYKILNGWYKLVQRVKFPIRIGFDFAGEIIEPGSSDLDAGQKVFGSLPYKYMGSFAQACQAPAHCFAALPLGVTAESAAAVAMTGLTSIQALKKLKPLASESILIHAGSGGVGSFAIQYAKELGLEVYTTTSSKNVDFVRSLGADHVIPYDKQEFSKSMPEVDMVFDTLGKDSCIKSMRVIKEGGRMVSISGGIDEEAARSLGVNAFIRFIIRLSSRPLRNAAKRKNVNYSYVLMDPNKDDLTILAELLKNGSVKAVIEEKFSLEKLPTAYERIMTNRTRGKLLIEMD